MFRPEADSIAHIQDTQDKLTSEQRQAIRERDCNRCQFPHAPGEPCPGELGKGEGQIHHVVPQRWGKDHGWTEEELDVPENVIYIDTKTHQKKIHPDTDEARKVYRYDKKSYDKTFNNRDKLSKRDQKYWVDKWDEQMKEIARKRTEEAKKNGWQYPPKKSI